MSFNLWKYFFENDVEGFRQYLARATFYQGPSKVAASSPAGPSFKIGSPGNVATSPRTPTKSSRTTGSAIPASGGRNTGVVITRADINARDSAGRTILHHAASSRGESAAAFVEALLEVPTVDLYVQDSENGWTALHRALYAGNVGIAQALLTRDALNATDFTSQTRTQVGGLVKIKDHEGNSPFEVFGLTIAPRDLTDPSQRDGLDLSDEEDANSVDVPDDAHEGGRSSRQMRPQTDLRGDEVYAFGSNKNLSLGLGDEDDRQFPERIQLNRPEHLLWRLYEDHKTSRYVSSGSDELTSSIASLHQCETLPAIIKHKPIKIQNVVMAKLHTAVLTDDPISNLHVCGFGPGGRLGTGDEATRFSYVCIQGGGLATRRVASIALGQDHCVAICSSGEVFTWGSNKFGQLGYVLPEVSSKETPVQLVPRQLYGLVKKETIIGAAASSIHSVIYTSTGLYTFGKNEGQLGLMDADARSLRIQDIPRRVGVSLLQSQIRAVSAIDRATTVLLENRDVIVFTHYGFTKVLFPLEESNIFLSQALPTRYSKEANTICKITSGGNTIGALSSFGQVFTVDVPKPLDSVPSNVSTTNPNKARNALPVPNRVWTLRKSHMSAADVAIGQDGSIILCTEAGAVWRKEKRAKIKSVQTKGLDTVRPKDYKFVRVPHITRAIAVRSNAFGAFTAVRKDSDVTQQQIFVERSMLLENLFSLLPFHNYGTPNSIPGNETTVEAELRFWLPAKKKPSPASIKTAILRNQSVEEDFLHISKRFEPLSETQYDIWVKSNVADVRIPVHSTILKSRSRVLRSLLTEFHEMYYRSIPEVISIEYGQGGEVELTLHGADFLTLVNFVFYLYTESLVDVWHHTSRALHLAPRYRQVRIELMKIASNLELRQLERAVRVMVDPTPCVNEDLEMAYMDLDFYSNTDVIVDLAGGYERTAHSLILSSRCPFFEGLFHGRAGGMWLSTRQHTVDEAPQQTRVDLKHVNAEIFDLVARHIYADTADELFDNIVSKDLDEFIDTVIDVMSLANELMLDRLVQVCQRTIGKFVTPRNVCGLLNTIAESSIDEFKSAALEYLCLNLEGMLEQRLLSDLDQYLLEELGEVVQDNQLAFMPFVRSDRAQNELFSRYPELVEQLERSKQRRVDSMKLQTRWTDESVRPLPKPRFGSFEKYGSSPVSLRKVDLQMAEDMSPRISPAINPKDLAEDLPFNMDEDGVIGPGSIAENTRSTSSPPSPNLVRRESDNPFEFPAQSGGEVSNYVAEEGDLDHPLSPSITITQALPFGSRVSGFELPKAVWKQSSLHEARTDLKEIMEQATTSRVSNLTQAMKVAGPSKAPLQKMSQKERKRQQQQQQQQAETQKEMQKQPTLDYSRTTSVTQSPWTQIIPSVKPDLGSIMSEAPASPTPIPLQRPKASTRQTVPSANPPEKQTSSNQKRSASTIDAPQTTAAPQIQSIRHTPLPIRSGSFVDAHTSMADILAQQLGEKTAIREAAAKRSLQDIQQEQEFQEWWDQESRRVQEEEAQATASTSTRSDKTSRGKSNRRRGHGRGGTASITKEKQPNVSDQPPQKPPGDDAHAMRGSSEARGRGHNRGRGRGRPRQERETRPSK